MVDVTIAYYTEQPERPLIEGEAVQLRNDDEAVLQIARWLNEQGIVAWVTPSASDVFRGAYLRIPDAKPRAGSPLAGSRPDAFPDDWIIVQRRSTGRNHVFIIPSHEFETYFTKR